MTRAKGRRQISCTPVELDDGTVGLVRSWGELTEVDRKALSDFAVMLRCENCVNREQCALNGCAQEKLRQGSSDAMVDATEENGRNNA